MSTKFNVKTFQGMILALQEYWANQGCTVVQPFDMEVQDLTTYTQFFLPITPELLL